MSTLIGSDLPAEILAAFDGSDLEDKIGTGHLLVTLDEDGTARPCMLSAGELLATGPRELRLALWQGTHTARNLASDRPVLFCFVAGDAVFYVRGHSRELTAPEGADIKVFTLKVDSVESDLHAGMPVTSGITFAVAGEQKPGVVASWGRQLDALRTAGD